MSSTDIYIVKQGQYSLASLDFCKEHKSVWVKYIPKNQSQLLNIDLNTR